MKAIIYTQYGRPEASALTNLPMPVPSDDELLVRVHAVSINDWDFGLMQGDFVNRAINGFLKPRRRILGSDIAGVIHAVGKNVTRFKTGDAVYGDLSGRWGGFAEYCCAKENEVALKPAAMSFVDAAAIPQAGMLAVQGLIDVGKIQRGEKILVNGAGGGVGTFAVQIARLYDAEVTGVDHKEKKDMMRAVGFHHVIDYTATDFTRNGQQYDLVLDAKSNRSPFDYGRALKPGGRYVTVGGAISRLLQMLLLRRFVPGNKQFRLVALKANKDLGYMNELYESGKIKPVIDGPYPLADFQQAFRIYGKAGHKGKVVLTM